MKRTLKILLCVFLLVVMGGVFIACNSSQYSNIEKITVDPSIDPNVNTSFEGFAVSTFSIDKISLIIQYKKTVDENGNEVPGETETIKAADYMLKAEDREKMKKPGTNQIVLVYGKFQIPYTLKLYDGVAEKYSLTFYAEDGTTELGLPQRVAEGGRGVQPSVPTKEGYVFIGWTDIDTNKSATFDNIRKNTRLKATYVAENFVVGYYYNVKGEDVLIEEKTISYDENGEDSYPDYPQLEGYDFLNWTKESNTKFYAEYQPTVFKIEFKYRKYTGEKYEDSFATETVSYSAEDSFIVPPADYIPGGEFGLSKANDYKFMYWYATRNGKDVKVEFPVSVTNMYETAFTAAYIDINQGNPELSYKKSSDDECIVNEYNGNDDVIVIPRQTKMSDGKVYTVTGIAEGAFKSVNVKEFVVSSDNMYFAAKNGVLYSKDGSILYAYPVANESKSYTIDKNTLEVSAYAFNNAKNLVSVTLNEDLLLIDNFAFKDCIRLETIEISRFVQALGEGAFKMTQKSAMESITFLGTDIESFGDEAFYGLNNLQELVLPASLTTIGDGVFYGCSALKRVNAERNVNFVEKNGALYSSDYRTLYVYPSKYSENVNPEVVIDARCQEIMRGAFYEASITQVTLISKIELEPYSIICPSLKSVRIDNTDFIYETSQFRQAFADYPPRTVYVKNGVLNVSEADSTDETDFVFYDTATALPDYFEDYAYSVKEGGVTVNAYHGDSKYVIVPTRIEELPVVEIAANAFNGNKNIISVELPIFVAKIGRNAFLNCDELEAVDITSNADIDLEIGDKAFSDCEKLSNVTFSRGAKVKKFGKYVFENTALMNTEGDFVTVGNVLIAFKGTGTSVNVPANVTYIATDVFKDLGQITSLTFETGSKIETIDSYAFFNCTGIKELSFPASIKEVRESAFYGCDFLYSVKYATTKENVFVDDGAYYQAGLHYEEGLTEEYIDSEKGVINYHIEVSTVRKEGLAFVSALDPSEYNEYITTNNLIIGWFYEREYKNRAVFPLKLTNGQTLELYALIVEDNYVSDGLVYSRNSDGTYTIIGFDGTDKNVIMTDTYMLASVTGIAENAFGETVVEISIPHELNFVTSQYVSKIVSIGIDAFVNTAWYKNTAGDFVTYDNLLIGYKGDAKTVIVPSSVSILAEGVFKNNKSIEYVVLPSSVTTIPKETFSGCTALKKVVLGTEVVSIGENAFKDCVNLTDVNFDEIPSLSNIAGNALDNTAWLKNSKEDCVIINGILYKYFGNMTKLHVPSGITTIADKAFEGNAKLTTLYLPSSVNVIRDYAFANAISLSSVYIPSDGSTLAYILEGAFKNCYNLGTINLAEAKQLAEIGDYAFENTSVFKSLYAVSSLNYLGKYAFRNSGIVSLTFEEMSRLTKIGDGAFYGCRSLESVVFNGQSSLNTIGKYAFYECSALKKFSNSAANILLLDDYAFYNCRNLSDVSINENALSSLGSGAVEKMGYISSRNSNMVVLGNILIAYNGTEKRVTVPANIGLIYDEAFAGNTEVVEVIFESQNNLKKINDRAFYGCSALERIDFPQSVETVGHMVMDGTAWYNNKLNSEEFIMINNTLVKYNADFAKQAEVPDTVTKIIRGAFAGNEIYDIKIGENVQLIEEGAFDGIIPTTWHETTKETDGTTTYTEYNGWTLTVMANSPMQIDYQDVIGDCAAIYLQNEKAYAEYVLDLAWNIQRPIIKVIEKYVLRYNVIEGEAAAIDSEEVHALYNAKDVKAYQTTSKQFVFVGWFEDAEYTTALTYPFILTENTTIYAKCVDYDEGSNPENYQLEDEDGGYTIVDYLDRTDKHVVIITQQAGKDIVSVSGHLGYILYSGTEKTRYVYDEEEQAFKVYDAYQNYPEGTMTYARNDVIEEINFANNCTIETLGENSFSGMVNLEKIVIPASVKRIGVNAFADCVNLREIVFDGDISNLTIETGAFANCASLQKVTFPVGVTSFSDGAFSGCTNLKEVYFESETPIVLYDNARPFELNAELKIYVPYGRKSAYSSNWQYYYDYLFEMENKTSGEEE